MIDLYIIVLFLQNSAPPIRVRRDSRIERKRAIAPMAASKLQALWNHPAGPKTSEFFRLIFYFLIFFLKKIHFPYGASDLHPSRVV